MPDPRARYATEKAQGMSHRHPLIALIYNVVADVLDHEEPVEETETGEAA